MYFIKLLLTYISIAVVTAEPQTALNVTANCIVTQFSQVNAAVSSCTNLVISNLRVPANQKLILNLKQGTTLTFRGTTIFDVGNLNDWLVTVSGTGITVIGERGSLIHGQGEHYWDGQGGGGGKIKPKLFLMRNVNNAKFLNINLKNCPMFCSGVNGANGLTIQGWNIDCSTGDKLARNTDGIGISGGNNIHINNVFIHNQDQCLYVNVGSNMVFTGIHCVGSNGICATAGFSATSYQENTTKNITFNNCIMEGGLTGVQLIAMAKPGGGPGEISGITFENIQLKGIRGQGIYVQMDFGLPGHPNNNLAITNIRMSNIQGTVDSNAKAVYIVCGQKCSNWQFSGINIQGSRVKNQCNFQPSGFHC